MTAVMTLKHLRTWSTAKYPSRWNRPNRYLLTPIAFNAVDTGEKNIPNIHTANDDDGPRSSGDEHKSDGNTRFKNGTYRGMLSGGLFTRLSETSCVTDTSRERTKQTCANFSLGNKTLSRRRNDSCFSAKNRRRVLKWAKTGTWARIEKGTSKTALFIATGPRFLFLTTYEGDIRRRS